MKNWKSLFIFIIIIFTSLGIIQTFKKVKFLRSESQKKIIFNDYAKKLKRCFDLENKNHRKINESLNLIKFCIKEFGVD